MKNIYLIVGASGSGKTSLVTELERHYGYKSIPSYTTRLPRHENELGHTFITKEEFDKLENIVAYTEYDNNFYAATSEQVNNYDLYVIDPAGIKYFKENYVGAKGVVIIYLKSPLTVRMERMEQRNGFDEALNRIKKDIFVFKDSELIADKVFVNNEDTNISELADEVAQFIKAWEEE